MRHGFGHGHGFEGADVREPFGPHAVHAHAGFGPRPGFGPQQGRQDVHVHVHLHDADVHEGHGRRHDGRPHPEA